MIGFRQTVCLKTLGPNISIQRETGDYAVILNSKIRDKAVCKDQIVQLHEISDKDQIVQLHEISDNAICYE